MRFPQVVRDLLAARARIARDGWCQGDYEDGRKRCALGALGEHTKASDETAPALNALVAVTGEPATSIWNDHPSRTKAEVLAAFDEAASLALSESMRP